METQKRFRTWRNEILYVSFVEHTQIPRPFPVVSFESPLWNHASSVHGITIILYCHQSSVYFSLQKKE